MLLEPKLGQFERAGERALSRALDVLADDVEVDASMARPIGVESTQRLLELALAARLISAGRVQPSDCDMHETLEEVALRLRRLAPLVLELLVRLEVGSGADELQPALEGHPLIIGSREGW
jgi:hypothetical protein